MDKAENEPQDQHVEDDGMLARMRLRMRISTWRVMRMMIRMMRCERDDDEDKNQHV